jgi:hypothetical protein
MEMYLCLGRPKPPLPERFMKPDEEKEVYAFFESMLREKGGQRGVAPMGSIFLPPNPGARS